MTTVSGDTGGPYLSAALLCEKVLKEQDGVTSAIRIVDRLTIGAAGPEAPDEMPPQQFAVQILLILRSGAARSREQLHLMMERPTGQSSDLGRYPVFFEGEDRGVELIINAGLTLDVEGLYWIDVRMRDRLLTRMSLRLIYQPARPPQA